uniref:Uncharacterized protein n=1 Tax=Pyxicephalus adspersus TaxID=30357 RepID=A0AAV3AYZ9_PYXAD|nr:TPA: hypothetical protein GDO54_009774 [Pyxicephalus adspersus]
MSALIAWRTMRPDLGFQEAFFEDNKTRLQLAVIAWRTTAVSSHCMENYRPNLHMATGAPHFLSLGCCFACRYVKVLSTLEV